MTFDPKHRSRAITERRNRAGARSMFKAVGFTDEDLAKPIMGSQGKAESSGQIKRRWLARGYLDKLQHAE